MIAPLRLLLLGLVLLGLLFVHLTGAVGDHWMLALWLATALAPLLLRWHERLLYRGLWNAAVLVSFAFLVDDALTSGLLHMLEDGLLLAALCQVHLLNNLGRRQRPDLLFFNSFLIAFVTSFFCGDLAWSLCFCGYAALLVPALQLHVGLPRDGAADAAAVRALLRDGAPRSALALLLTAVVFAVWPRDFHREGWLGDALQFSGQPMVAFAEEVRLDRTVTPTLSDAEVMRIRGERGAVPSHWRGATFVDFDGAGWQPYRAIDFGARSATDPDWRSDGRGSWQRGFAALREPLAVRLLDNSARRLFLPVDAGEFAVRDGAALVDPKADAIVTVDDVAGDGDGLHATVRVGVAPPPAQLGQRARALLCRVPRRVPQALAQLASTLRSQLPADAAADDVAEHARDWLAQHRRYALPGTTGAARNLDEFLLGTGAGHCEYFATTLALLLRLQGIPCRLAGGYLAHEWDDAAREVVVRQRDAHAWVEMLSPLRGWTPIDATPAPSEAADAGGAAWWRGAVDAMQRAWQHVAGFGEDDRRALLQSLFALPGALLAALCGSPLAAVTVIALLAAALWYRRRRARNGAAAAVVNLRAAFARAGIAPRPGETPREVLTRAGAASSRPDAVAALAAAVAAHEAARYAGPRGA